MQAEVGEEEEEVEVLWVHLKAICPKKEAPLGGQGPRATFETELQPSLIVSGRTAVTTHNSIKEGSSHLLPPCKVIPCLTHTHPRRTPVLRRHTHSSSRTA